MAKYKTPDLRQAGTRDEIVQQYAARIGAALSWDPEAMEAAAALLERMTIVSRSPVRKTNQKS